MVMSCTACCTINPPTPPRRAFCKRPPEPINPKTRKENKAGHSPERAVYPLAFIAGTPGVAGWSSGRTSKRNCLLEARGQVFSPSVNAKKKMGFFSRFGGVLCCWGGVFVLLGGCFCALRFFFWFSRVSAIFFFFFFSKAYHTETGNSRSAGNRASLARGIANSRVLARSPTCIYVRP